MESIEEAINLLGRKRAERRKNFEKIERKQIEEYNELMTDLQNLKDERNQYKENISKNLQLLTTEKDMIDKLIRDSNNISSLPITHTCHREAKALFSEAIEFINNLPQMYKTFDTTDQQNINPEELVNNITSCINSLQNEFSKIKSVVAQVNTLQESTNVLEEYCIVPSEDDVFSRRILF